VICTDFPTCHGELFPTFSGIIGLQVIHRTFAYFVVGFGLFVFFWIRGKTEDASLRKASRAFAFVVFLQFCVGVSNVLLKVPPIIGVTHLALATALLGLATFCFWRSRILSDRSS